MPGNTPLVSISSVAVSASPQPVPDVIINSFTTVSLIINCFVNASLFGNGFRFDANFQIVRGADNQIVSNNWWSQATGGYPFSLDNFRGFGSNFFILLSNGGNNFGLNDGDGNNAEGGNNGMYIFRPYFFVDTGLYSANLVRSFGTSQFAFGADHPFWVE
jgi:hypothetical protein